MPEVNAANTAPRVRVGSLFSGYGGLDLAVEEVFDGETVWFCEINEPVAGVFAQHWPGAPNLGDITTIDWSTVEPVDVLCGGFPCQDVSTVGKMAGLAPGTPFGAVGAHGDRDRRAATRLRGHRERPRPAVRARDPPTPQRGDDDERRNLTPATGTATSAAAVAGATPGGVEPDPWGLGDQPTRPLRAAGAVLGDLVDLRYDAQWIGLPASRVGTPHPRYRVFILAHRTVPHPLASDAARGGESLQQVKARRGTIALSHQIIDLALHGPNGYPPPQEPESLWHLIGQLFDDGDATPEPSDAGSTSPGGPPRPPRS